MGLSSLRWLSHWRHAQGRYLWRRRPRSPQPARQSKRSRIWKNILKLIIFCNLATCVPTFSWPYQEFSKEIKVAWKCTRHKRTRKRVTNIFETYNEHKVWEAQRKSGAVGGAIGDHFEILILLQGVKLYFLCSLLLFLRSFVGYFKSLLITL